MSFLADADAYASEDSLVRFEFGGGARHFLDAGMQDIHGLSPELHLGVAGRISDGDAWVCLDVGWSEGRGDLVPPDDTFQVEQVRHRTIPMALTLRWNLVSEERRTKIQLYGAMGGLLVHQRYEDPFGTSESDTDLGFVAELRPEIELTPSARLWLRSRIALITASTFANIGEVDVSSFHLGMGVSYAIH